MNTYSIALTLTPGCDDVIVLGLAVRTLRTVIESPINIRVDFNRTRIELGTYEGMDAVFAATAQLTNTIPGITSSHLDN